MITVVNLKESRIKLKKAQKEIAKDLQVTISTVSGWETGKDSIPLKKLIYYANCYDYSLDYLFGLEKESTKYKPLNIDLKKTALNLKELRNKNKLSQEIVAKLINTTQSAYSHYETATNLITTTFLYNLTRIYEPFSIDELLGREKIE